MATRSQHELRHHQWQRMLKTADNPDGIEEAAFDKRAHGSSATHKAQSTNDLLSFMRS